MSKLEIAFKYFVYFVLFYILHSATIKGLQPFAFGMLFALVWCNQKIYFLVPLYIIAGVLSDFCTQSLIIDSITCGVFMLAYFLHFKFKKRLNPYLIGIYAFLSQFGALYMASADTYLLANSVLSLILGMICMYAYLHLLQGISLKGLRRKFTIDEIICLGVLLFSVGAGLYSIPQGEYIFLGFATFTILFVSFVFGFTQSLLTAIFLSLGGAFASEQFLLLSHFVFISLAVGATVCSKRVYACISAVMVDIVSGLYFLPIYSLEHLVSVLIGATLFLIIPKKQIDRITSFVIKDKEDIAVRTIINRNRQALCNRLYELSEVFLDMKNVFYDMMKGTKNINQASSFLVENVKQRNCANCQNKNVCLKMYAEEITESLRSLILYAYERGKVSIIDVSPVLSANCNKLSLIIVSINQIVEEFKSSIQAQNNLDSGKLLLSEQMWGISQIMRSLATEVSLNVSFDTTKERNLVEELMYAGVVCSEAIIYQQTESVSSVTLSVQNKDANNPKIAKIVSKVIGLPMEISSKNLSEKAGFSILILQNSNLFDVIFGSARSVKADSKKSGDTYSVLKLGNDKIMLALCDGMGSGIKAEKTSSLALGMIENFYKAGFDNDLILTNVNKLLALSGEETFSALDVCIIDLHTGTCDLIKVGSTISFIKRDKTIQQIDACALPLGILEELHPNIRSFVLKENDMIVLMSDGIVDSFACIDDLTNLLNSIETLNPQNVANIILNKALDNNKNIPADDMTVLVGRIFRKL